MCVKALRCDPKDIVAVVSQPVKAGTAIDAAGETLTALEDIALGHKIALRDIAAGELVYKYGVPIGRPLRPSPRVPGFIPIISRTSRRSCATVMPKNSERKRGQRYEQKFYGL